MKEVILFELPFCPHCRLARRFQDELFQEHPEWREISLRIINEAEERALAASYDYYYVPTYYVGGVKVHEGHAEKIDVEKVFRLASEK